jgi:tRNA-uridine 2-sulfurtransferase
VAALALREAGYQVRAATLKLWPGDDERSCCSPAAVARARESAHAIGSPHFSVNDEPRFEAEVVAPFVGSYLAGETPNPCIACNPGRLRRLVSLADRFGAAWVATGHYARVVRVAGAARVARGRDRDKDQSYMLWRVPPETLERLLLPLGELTKPEVRARARRAGLPPAEQAESQDVCFAPGDHREFLAARGAPARRGEIVDGAGRVLGSHDGWWRFTVGQRRGLGVSADEPLYVLAIEPESERVVVGPADRLVVSAVEVRELADRGLGDGRGLVAQLRYRGAPVRVASLTKLGGDRARIELGEPFAGAAPGQSAVLYRDDVVVGGGIITKTGARRSTGPAGVIGFPRRERGPKRDDGGDADV